MAHFNVLLNGDVKAVGESRPAVKLALNQCEFALADDVNVDLGREMSDDDDVCVGIAIVATLGGLKSGQVVLGRLVLGSNPALAYGSGMNHWNEVASHRGMIRRHHWLC